MHHAKAPVAAQSGLRSCFAIRILMRHFKSSYSDIYIQYFWLYSENLLIIPLSRESSCPPLTSVHRRSVSDGNCVVKSASNPYQGCVSYPSMWVPTICDYCLRFTVTFAIFTVCDPWKSIRILTNIINDGCKGSSAKRLISVHIHVGYVD